MPEFPRTEPEIIALTKSIANALAENSFSSIPADKEVLDELLQSYSESTGEIARFAAGLKAARGRKREVLGRIVRAARDDLSFLQLIYRHDPAKLTAFGWGKRRARHKPGVPGQPRHLEILRAENGTLFLDWKSPVDGGKVVAYLVKRRAAGEDEFQTVHSVAKTEAKLISQPRRVPLDFQVAAMNKVGESLATNTVSVVL